MPEPANATPFGDSPLGELGLSVRAVGDQLHGTLPVIPELCFPGTRCLRVSVLATHVDSILGLLAVRSIAPRVPVTLELDVQLFDAIRGHDSVEMVARVTKSGSVVQVYSVDINAGGQRVGFGHTMFMAAPDATLTLPEGDWALDLLERRRPLVDRPIAERVGCRRTGPGEAELACAPPLMNSSNTLNGGLLSLAAEEAVLSALDEPAHLTSLHLRYLRPVRRGPAVARADVQGTLAEVEIRDAATGSQAVVATARVAPGG